MKRLISIWLSFLLVISPIYFIIVNDGNVEGRGLDISLNYVVRGQIVIASDADFIPANGVTGGPGTELQPWIIEGWDIDILGSQTAISITNTSDYFILRDCYLHHSGTGLWLTNVTNGLIQNNRLSGNQQRIIDLQSSIPKVILEFLLI